MIELKTDDQLALMQAAGLVVATALDEVTAAVRPGVTTADLDGLAEQVIRDHRADPSFLGYHGFTGSICASVGAEVVHGIPRPDRMLSDGELISIDCGAVLDGWHGDSARTVVVGEPTAAQTRLLRVTEDSMWAGIAAGVAGARLGDISHAVESTIERHSHEDGLEYGIVETYGGHGIGTAMHQDPHILNYGKPGRGPRLMHGMALAIEPMVTIGSPDVDELADGWTVRTRDGSDAAHCEHTYAITDSGPWVLTAHDGGLAGLAAYDVTLSDLAAR